MASFQRKLKRLRQRETEKDMQEKLALMSSVPENCNMCDQTFDKKDRNQVSSWFVAVREEEKKVNLYCPDCWSHAQETIRGLMGTENV